MTHAAEHSKITLVFALVAALLTACAEYDRASPAAAKPAHEPPAVGAGAGDDSGGKEGNQTDLGTVRAEQTETQRKLIQNAELHLEVASYGDARRAVEAELAKAGGYLSSAQIDHREGQVSRAQLVLRLPATKLKPTLQAYAKLGTVVHETLTTQDITEEYYDLKARLDNARKLEARLLELLATEAKELKDLLEVEKELARVREQIERFEGKLRLWDKQVAYSTLTLELITRDIYAAGKPRTMGEQISQTFSRSWEALQKAGRGLLLVLVALVPWMIPLLLLGWLGLRLVRWMGRRMAAKTRARQQAYAAAQASGYVTGLVPQQPHAPPPQAPSAPAKPPSTDDAAAASKEEAADEPADDEVDAEPPDSSPSSTD